MNEVVQKARDRTISPGELQGRRLRSPTSAVSAASTTPIINYPRPGSRDRRDQAQTARGDRRGRNRVDRTSIGADTVAVVRPPVDRRSRRCPVHEHRHGVPREPRPTIARVIEGEATEYGRAHFTHDARRRRIVDGCRRRHHRNGRTDHRRGAGRLRGRDSCRPLDLDVTLVEKDAYGGTCLNYGCIPSKALITATDVAHDGSRHRRGDGDPRRPAIDLAGMMDWKDGVVDQLTSGVEKLCKANQVNLLEGTARFADENTVRVSHAGGSGARRPSSSRTPSWRPVRAHLDSPTSRSTTGRPELATGARARFVPDSMVVVGGAGIGMELASVFAKLGTDVTVVKRCSTRSYRATTTTSHDQSNSEPEALDRLSLRVPPEWYEPGDGIRVVAEPVDGAAANGETPRRSKRNASSSMSRTSS